MITITHDQTRETTTAYAYDVLIDGEIVAAAKNWHAADLAGEEIQERADAPPAHEMEIEGMRLVATERVFTSKYSSYTCECGAPATRFVHGRAIAEDVCEACFKRNYQDNTQLTEAWEADPLDLILTTDPRPLLRQCADLIDALLGGPVVGGGILDEMRRVRAELRKEGW